MKSEGCGQLVPYEYTQFYAPEPTVLISTVPVPRRALHQRFCPPVCLAPPLFQAKTSTQQTSFCPKKSDSLKLKINMEVNV